MSRSGYDDDYCDDELAAGRWRGMVASAIRGRRGQAFLREMLAALDAMPEKRLIAEDLVNEDGDVCAMGVVGRCRGLDMENLDPEDPEQVAKFFGIAEPLVQEIAYENDEKRIWDAKLNGCRDATPEERWWRMREWVVGNIKQEPTP